MDNQGGELSPRRRRLLFRARHRGTKEADLLVGGFVSAHIAGMTEPELDAVEELLELPDVDLADWLSGRRPVPPALRSPMMIRLLEASSVTGAGVPDGVRTR
ncbi:succinate dehydrogenase assembly factor 2 [Muricoccus radiodurans]|uniref:FAD assembly factor SdhE n=1 Tax=Muricoccus radiodurans TaxID=2231721 RepID=UPI003CF2D07E